MNSFFKTLSGTQFFEVLPDNRLRVVSTCDFNPAIEIRPMRADTLTKLKLEPCTQEDFDDAEVRAQKSLGLISATHTF